MTVTSFFYTLLCKTLLHTSVAFGAHAQAAAQQGDAPTVTRSKSAAPSNPLEEASSKGAKNRPRGKGKQPRTSRTTQGSRQDHKDKSASQASTRTQRVLSIAGLVILLFVGKRKLEFTIVCPAATWWVSHNPPQDKLRSVLDRHGRPLCYLSPSIPEKDRSKGPLYVFFTGNGWPIDNNTFSHVHQALNIPAQNLCMFMYPGSGPSQTAWSFLHSDQTLYDALDDFMEALQSEGYKPENTTLIGHSLGSTCVFYLASKYKCKQAVTMAAFSSLRNVARDKWCGLPLIMHHHFDNLAWGAKLQCPWQGFHGEDDALVSPTHLKDLYNALPEAIKAQSTMYLLSEVGHNDFLAMAFEVRKVLKP